MTRSSSKPWGQKEKEKKREGVRKKTEECKSTEDEEEIRWRQRERDIER